MKINTEKLIGVVLEQAKAFLLEMGEFYPFGTYINTDDKIIPMSAHSENEDPSPQELVNILHGYIQTILKSNVCKLAAIAINVTINSQGHSNDVIEIRLFDQIDNQVRKLYYKYDFNKDNIKFTEISLNK